MNNNNHLKISTTLNKVQNLKNNKVLKNWKIQLETKEVDLNQM